MGKGKRILPPREEIKIWFLVSGVKRKMIDKVREELIDLVQEGIIVYPSQQLPAKSKPEIPMVNPEELELREEITGLTREAEAQGIITALSTVRISL